MKNFKKIASVIISIVIDKPGPQDFGDGVGKERWQQARHFLDGYQGDID